MKVNTLTWSEVQQIGRASLKGVVFPLPAKPVLSFDYDGLYYEDTLSIYFLDGKGIDLTPAQTDELDSYIFQAFNDQLNYVHAYDKNYFYMGYIKANTPGIVGSVNFGPMTINERYRYDPVLKKWIMMGGVDQNGVWLGKPVQMTDTRFYAEVDEAPPQPFDKWDFAANSWVDGRSADTIRSMAMDRINKSAEVTRLRFITDGAGQAATYQLKAAEAARYMADPAPNNANYPMLLAEATATNVTVAQLANAVSAQATAWTFLAGQIEALRMKYKAELLTVTNQDGADAVILEAEHYLALVGAQ